MAERKKLWLTYAWHDNGHLDVDYVCQELEKQNLEVHIDRWDIPAGQKLWRRIEAGICDPERCDAWSVLATENSLRSPACIEELDYAVYRALSEQRGEGFPLVGIFPSYVIPEKVPAALKVRRYVTLEEPDWAQQVASGARNELPPRTTETIPQTDAKWHKTAGELVLELRPRAGVWSPPAILLQESESAMLPWVSFGAPSMPAQSPMMIADHLSGDMNGKRIRLSVFRQNQATPTTSMYLHFASKPTTLMVGYLGANNSFTAKYIEQCGSEVQVL